MSTATNKNQTITQEICIDLPGETVQCWRSSDNVKVVLRKHRDVIFDLALGKGKTYTVHASHSDFYNARDKKLVLAAKKDVVAFVDGERLHLWLTRGFKGALIVNQGSKVILKIIPDELDQNRYDNDPKTKPAPIIISLGGSRENQSKLVVPLATQGRPESARIMSVMPASTLLPSAAPVDCPLVCIFDGSKKGMPDSILKSLNFKSGGGDSGLVDIDPNDVLTRNWLWGQVAGSTAYTVDNWEWLKACIEKKPGKDLKIIKAKIGYIRGKIRFFFSGYTKDNKVFRQGGYGPGNSKIVNIFAGVGKTKSSFLAAAKGVAGSFKGFAGISLLFGSATTYAEWVDDTSKDGYDLAAALIMSILKTIVVAAIVVAIVAFVVGIVMVAMGVSIPVLVIGALSIVLGFAVNYGVEAVDKKTGKIISGNEKNGDGMNAVIAPMLRKASSEISESWTDLMRKFPKDYQWIEF